MPPSNIHSRGVVFLVYHYDKQHCEASRSRCDGIRDAPGTHLRLHAMTPIQSAVKPRPKNALDCEFIIMLILGS